MDLQKAQALKVGNVVHCPTDRGEPAFYGKVEWVGGSVAKNIYGAEYIWVNVRGPHHTSCWPSNRLG